MRSVLMMVAGIVVGSIGTAGLIGGIAMFEREKVKPSCGLPQPERCWNFGIHALPWAVFAAFGASLFVTGGILTGIGVAPAPAERPHAPSLSLGPGSARLTWTF